MSFKYLFKFIVVGDSGVGKSCLLLKFSDNRFRPDHDLTIGVEFGSKEIEIADETVHLQIWDTAGQESFRSITRAYYKGATAALLVYDITRRSSFQSLVDWISEINDNSNLSIVTVLIGNKSDLGNRVISTEEGKEFAEKHGLIFLETSAKTGQNVEQSFESAAAEVMDRVKRGEIKVDELGNFVKRQKVTNEKKRCCS